MTNHPDIIAPEIIAIGEPLAEFVYRDDVIAKNGQTGEFYQQGFGGDTSNAIIAASRQGAKTGYITALGDDPFAKGLMKLWQAENVDTSTIKLTDQAPTGIYFVNPVPDGHEYTYFRKHSAAALMTAEDLPLDYIANAKILHISGISLAISHCARDAVFAAINYAKANGTMISVDTNLRLKLWSLDEARKAIHQAMENIDIALPSYDDATLLTGLTDPDEIVSFYHDLGAKIVALKLGGDGCRLSFDGSRHDIAPHKVKAVDSTAAGDTFAGAFLAQILKTNDPKQAARYANIAAALCVTKYGAAAAIPHRDAVETILNGYAINTKAAMVAAQEFSKALIAANKPGAIVNVSSISSFVGFADHAAYCASKGAMDAMSRVMANELGQYGIRVNCINPIVTMTELAAEAWSDPAKSEPIMSRIPLGKFAEVNDVANLIVFLLSEKSRMLNATTIPVDGGFLAR
ncbi:MAG: PfkB family carbohydrate kinase [Hyphomicrobiales bacterium]|nr:PfkB family carbohydrate kinase [Hyphomicrobiales bacterium]